MADILNFPARPAPKLVRLPQVNLAVVALVNQAVIAAVEPDYLDDLTDAQLAQAIEETAALVEKMMDLAEKRRLKARTEG